MGKQFIKWEREFDTVKEGSFLEANVRWFTGGKLNVSVQCLDRHISAGKGDKVALIWDGDELGDVKKYSYSQVLAEVCKVANVLKKYGVRKGDPVTIYMPMVPQLAFVMLACTRIGAPHSVVFAGFSAESLRERVVDVRSRFIFTCDEGMRGGKPIGLKKCVDTAIDHRECEFVEKVFVFKRTGTHSIQVNPKVDVFIEEELDAQRPYCPPESMDSEDILFFLYTSGSTGKPKGVAHTTAGYILYATITHKFVFDIQEHDVYGCVADCGWITGHSYILYGPLSNGTTTVMFESTPLYPNCDRYWDFIQRHKITQFYTAPTALRALMRFGNPSESYDLSSLRVLGSVGEPINPEAWKWYFEFVGKKRCAVVDTYWQTENGGFLLTPFPGVTPMKPGSCTKAFFGIKPAVLDPQTGVELEFDGVHESEGVLCIASEWPGLARTVHNNHERYRNTYLEPYKGYYFTGDGCIRDKDGYFWITGRVDDVLNVSGHRIGSAELESALVGYDSVAEAAVVGIPHEVKGQGIAVYVVLKEKFTSLLERSLRAMKEEEDLRLMRQTLREQIRTVIGPFATPDMIIFTTGLPKTRSGKIMRRILRKIIENEALGDTSTLAEPAVVEELKLRVQMIR